MGARFCISSAACALALAGCSASAAEVPPDAGPVCSTNNDTRACSCGAQHGRQTCDGVGWSDCECAGPGVDAGSSGATEPPGNSSPNRFDWQRTEPGTCEAGLYEGSFEGTYSSPAAFGFPIPVASFPTLPGEPASFRFRLERDDDGEFLVVTGGRLEGTANLTFPFSADIIGTLDCGTLEFDAMLVNGTYNVFGTDYFFEGPLTGDYDKATHSFINGEWHVTEADPTVVAGGDGTWTTTWVP